MEAILSMKYQLSKAVVQIINNLNILEAQLNYLNKKRKNTNLRIKKFSKIIRR